MVELVVAAALAGVLLVGVSTAMGGGILAWRKAEELTSLAREGGKALRLLEDQLVRSLASEAFPFDGSATELHFVASDGTGPLEVRWSASLGSAPGEEGTLTGRWWTMDAGAAAGVAHQHVCPWVREIAFSYPMGNQEGGGYAWQETWASGNSIQVPQAVRVTLRLAGPRGGVVDLERVIVLPHGAFGTEEPQTA